MSELIKRPRANVERRGVEAAILRLMRYPATTSLGTVMRMVDEYAASQHTAKVYTHAERVVAEALVSAHRAMELNKNVYLCLVLSGVDPKVQEKYVKNFFHDQKYVEKIFIELFPENPDVVIMVDACRTCQTRPKCQECPKCVECPKCPHGSQCPICHETSVRDTSGTATFATDTPDTDGTVARATDTPDSNRPDPVAGGVLDVKGSDGKNGVAGTPTDGEGKRCTQCLVHKPLACYGRNRSRPDGHASACRECETARNEARKLARRKAANVA